VKQNLYLALKQKLLDPLKNSSLVIRVIQLRNFAHPSSLSANVELPAQLILYQVGTKSRNHYGYPYLGYRMSGQNTFLIQQAQKDVLAGGSNQPIVNLHHTPIEKASDGLLPRGRRYDPHAN
jgi:hypothetical protein